MKFYVKLELIPHRIVNKVTDAPNPLAAIKNVLIEENILNCSEIDYGRLLSATVTKLDI